MLNWTEHLHTTENIQIQDEIWVAARIGRYIWRLIVLHKKDGIFHFSKLIFRFSLANRLFKHFLKKDAAFFRKKAQKMGILFM